MPRSEQYEGEGAPVLPPELTDAVLDETVPGGAYIVGDVVVDADGVEIEAPPPPPLPDPPLAADDPNATAEQIRERQKWELEKLHWAEKKRAREQWVKDADDKDAKDKEREEKERALASQLPAPRRRGRPRKQ